MEDCKHPKESRWQWSDHWMCCVCMKRTFGSKDEYNEQDTKIEIKKETE